MVLAEVVPATGVRVIGTPAGRPWPHHWEAVSWKKLNHISAFIMKNLAVLWGYVLFVFFGNGQIPMKNRVLGGSETI